jgi:hypothetical protein
MFNLTRTSPTMLACLALALGGCNRALNYEKTITSQAGGINSFAVTPPTYQQKITLSFKSTETPVDVYITLQKDLEAAADALGKYQAPQNVLASKLKAKEGSLEATIPARTGFGGIVAGATKDTKVEVKITGK